MFGVVTVRGTVGRESLPSESRSGKRRTSSIPQYVPRDKIGGNSMISREAGGGFHFTSAKEILSA
jgi:hypothetical protein